jgi:hypothetical protein
LGTSPQVAGFVHQPLHALATDAHPASESQFGVNPGSAVDAAVGRVNLADLLEQPRIGQLTV